MRLKERLKQMYLQFGYSEDRANYHMLCDAEDWEALEAPVSNMLMKGAAANAKSAHDTIKDSKEEEKLWFDSETSFMYNVKLN